MVVTLRQFVKDLRQALGQASISHSMQLGKGQCATIEEYKKKVGFIAGLDAAGDIADQMMRQIEDAEEGFDDGKKKGGKA